MTPPPLDDEGFLATGDAGRLEDPADPSAGVVFDGRIAENFKLSTGSWVCVGELRVAIVGACAPAIQDAVLAGHDRDAVTAILFPGPTAAGMTEAALRAHVRAGLAAHNARHGLAGRVARAVVVAEPPSIDAGEITDKGYLNQRAVLGRRAAAVAALYAEPPPAEVIVVES